MTLTNENIGTLFAFCRKHYVHHYDVQVELVDHLANAIEEKMHADVQLSFEKALNNVYDGFGVKGFGEIVKMRTLALEKSNSKMRMRFVRSFFTWPKAAITACFFLALSFLPHLLSGDQLYLVACVFPFLLLGFEVFNVMLLARSWKQQKMKLLLTEMGKAPSLLALIGVQYFFSFPERSTFDHMDGGWFLVGYYISIFVAIVIVLALLAYKKVNRQLIEIAKKQYPEAFRVA